MGTRTARFRPPERALPAGVRWALIRAFGPPGPGVEAPEGAGVESALELRLGARIAARVGASALDRELGPAGAERLRRERKGSAARAAWIAEAGVDTVATLASAGFSPVLLKFAALAARGALAEGSRAASDLDLLLDPQNAPAARQALLEAGFVEGRSVGEEHHLPAVGHPRGVVVELHTAMLGVRVDRRSASAGDLQAAGLLEPAGGDWRGARLPSREALAAHALAHGLAQHGLSPRAYPLLQPIADLADLGWPALGEGAAGDLDAVGRLLCGTLDASEVAAAGELVERLRGGDAALLGGTAADGEAARLLHHLVWGLLDRRYRDALRVRSVTEPLSDLSPARARVRSALRAAWPSRDELAAIYGRPRDRVPLWLRLYRPVDLAARTLRSAWSAARSRRPERG